MNIYRLIYAGLLLFIACSAPKTAQKPTPVDTVVNLEDVEIVADSVPHERPAEANVLPTYQASYKREIDLIHTKLDLRFDWSKEMVIGKAELSCKAYFYPIKRFRLDAKGFTINNISLSGKTLTYDYDNSNLYINLDKEYGSKETFKILIDYTASPSTLPQTGSAAITSEKGLFFIDPLGTDPDKPSQIWTQGETENNSTWFPTVDKPNERCTEEMILTVDKKYKTLSNGIMLSSKDNGDGTRTDYWKLDIPHAPYLFMLAVGDFSVTKDNWKDIPLYYYVEPEYEKDAKQIFNNTPEMLDFFSNKFGLKYPWPTLSQIVVRDYVSGAMENTTGIIYGEFVQKHAEELKDNPNDYIVAHEISHHWFGDYVTTESWANLPLNEGFANYCEYLWFEHKFGLDEAEVHRYIEMDGYLGSAIYGVHPLINYSYGNEMEMFDAHSYNKGGLTLHMLRKLVGDDAFYLSLKKYLDKNALSPVEVDHLRQAFEEVTGQDLKWFFDQWYLSAGQPKIKISKAYDPVAKNLEITIEQSQKGDLIPSIFQFPLAIDVYDADGNRTRYDRWINEKVQSINIKLPNGYRVANVDPERTLICEREETLEPSEAANLYIMNPPAFSRLAIVKSMDKKYALRSEYKRAVAFALKDSIKYIRTLAMSLSDTTDASVMNTIKEMSLKDSSPEVRQEAIKIVSDRAPAFFKANLQQYYSNDNADQKAMVLAILSELDQDMAYNYALKLEGTKDPKIIASVASIYARAGKTEKLSWIKSKMASLSSVDVIAVMGNYAMLLSMSDKSTQQQGFDELESTAKNPGANKYTRFGATAALFQVLAVKSFTQQGVAESDKPLISDLKERLQRIIVQENDPDLKEAYSRFRLD